MPSNPSRRVLSALALVILLLPSRLPAANPPALPPLAKGDYTPAALGPREPDLEVDYPGAALARGIPKGKAVVSILVQADGKATDMLVVSCTDPAFGTALLDTARTLKFSAAKFRGTPVPARLNLAYNFTPARKSISVNAMEAARNRVDSQHEPEAVYSAVSERKLDQELEFTHAVVPQLPVDYHPTDGKLVMVFATFYVDEQGKVRAPSVESAAAPELISAAIEALQQWSFKPPLVKGKPVLVFTSRTMGFAPRKP